ncbi:MAG: glycosyltransferase family 2 protein, partial [Desulfobacterales bacterium]
MPENLPPIGVVIIGVNVKQYLADCIRSVRSADYPQDRIEIVYVDGGSRDESPQLAKAHSGVRVIELKDRHPTPGRGRNAGWQMLATPLIQFLDADTILNPLWFKKALSRLDEDIVAVCGHRREKFPHKNFLHVLTEMEWHYELGPCRYFGGDVLVKREALEKT